MQKEKQKQPCIVCGALCQPFGYVNKGKGQICSKACDKEHKKRTSRFIDKNEPQERKSQKKKGKVRSG